MTTVPAAAVVRANVLAIIAGVFVLVIGLAVVLQSSRLPVRPATYQQQTVQAVDAPTSAL